MMKYQALVRAAAVVLSAAALSGGQAVAQSAQAPAQPSPRTMVDTAPPPAEDRSSTGAIVMMDEPVLAQREMMMQAQAREPDTRAMGAASRVLQRELLREQMESQRAQDAASERRAR